MIRRLARPTALSPARTRLFTAMVVRSSAKEAEAAGVPAAHLEEFSSLDELPRQDPDATVEVDVTHSDLNYKDGLIVLGRPGVVKGFPIVPGIDFAGRVRSSRSPLFAEGDLVALTGNKAGQYFDGGFAQRAACQAEHLVKLPDGMSPAQAMTLGTAGITATMCVLHLERAGELTPAHGRVLVTGAAGGVGQVAVAVLAARGYEVVASTGRAATVGEQLRALGAADVVGRLEGSEKPLQKQQWAGVVDTVGGATLHAALAQTSYRGAVASTGNAGGGAIPHATVFPLILRGVRLLGVDSTMPWNLAGYPQDAARWQRWRDERLDLWRTMAECVPAAAFAALNSQTIGLAQVADEAQRILDGKVAGRVVVDLGL